MKDNKIIAEFMGLTEPFELPQFGTIRPDGEFKTEFNTHQLKYHTSWDWLMPVANEIIKSRDEQNADWDLTDLKYALQTTNIEYVYKAVVEFINEYNETK